MEQNTYQSNRFATIPSDKRNYSGLSTQFHNVTASGLMNAATAIESSNSSGAHR